MQRLTTTLDKRHRLYNTFCDELRGVFRQPGDKGENRTKPTPSSDMILKNIRKLIQNWESIEGMLDETSLLNSKLRLAIDNLEKHIDKGCLSDIPPGFSTGMNENLHKNMNKIFKGLKMGPELAMNLLTLFFFAWNCKRTLQIKGKKLYQSVFSCIPSKSELKIYPEKEKFGLGVSDKQDFESTDSVHAVRTVSRKHQSPKELFPQKCHLYKKIKTLSKVENIPLDFYYNEPLLHRFLSLHPVKHALPSFSANHDSALEERCQNFGFSLMPTVPAELDPVSRISINHSGYCNIKLHRRKFGI